MLTSSTESVLFLNVSGGSLSLERTDFFTFSEKLTFPDTFYDDFQRDNLHPVLMFKDFNSQGLFEKNDEFMTTADVPLLALKDIVKNPVNPFTKQILSDSIKHTQGAVVSSNDTWSPGQHGYSTFNIKDSEWYTVKDNIFDSRNWKKGK